MEDSLKSKHYTDLERNVFKEILVEYRDVIENNRSSTNSIKEKAAAWELITAQYNNSSLIETTRDAKQLKKLWSNMKATQRNAITKQRQSLMKTGGGPPSPQKEFDDVVASLTPYLMTRIPGAEVSDQSSDKVQDDKENVVKCTETPRTSGLSINRPKQKGDCLAAEKVTLLREELQVRRARQEEAMQRDKNWSDKMEEHEEELYSLKLKREEILLAAAEVKLRNEKKKELLLDIQLANAKGNTLHQ